jgi:DNA-binding transcriptional regulator LsrR (DeoR family)
MNAILWPGPYAGEAVKAFHRAIESDMGSLRALVIGCVGSFRDCWVFQRQIADRLGCSVRTVQRALRQARDLGLIECHRAHKNENAPGLQKPIPCGWSHRWVIGWGLVGEAVSRAINLARLNRMAPKAFRAPKRTREPVPKRWTASEIEEALRRRYSERPPD